MRGKAGRRRRSEARARAPQPRAPGRIRRVLPGVIAGAIAIVVAYAAVARWRRTEPVAATTPRAADPVAGMSATEAARMAARLFRENRAYESLPYFRRVAPELPPGRLDFRLEFATALGNASLQARLRTDARVGLMLESLDELARTERAVEWPRERARVIVARAFLLRVWGFPADASAELRRALATDPTYPDLDAIARLMERRLREPTLPLEALEGPGLKY